MQLFTAQLSAAMPDGWLAKESITLLDPRGQANVIASSEPLDPSIDTARYAEIQSGLLEKEFPGYRQLSYSRTELFGGRYGYERRFEWTPSEGQRVTQIQAYYAENGRGYTMTATTTTLNVPLFDLMLRQILGGVRINAVADYPEPRTRARRTQAAGLMSR